MKIATLLAALALVGLASGAAASPTKAPPRCASAVRTGVLPVWARTGFSDPRPRMRHVLGRNGGIVAILFANPLVVPPFEDRNNKILWVPRVPLTGLTNLRISAQRIIGTRRVGAPVARRVAGGPGPSIIDLPSAGCWRMSLHWAHTSDVLDLQYVPRPS